MTSIGNSAATSKRQDENVHNDNDQVEMEMIKEGPFPSAAPPLVPFSRLSKPFKEHLKGVSESETLSPCVFTSNDWQKKRHRNKPSVCMINQLDMSCIWSEVTHLVEKYEKQKFSEWMPYYYFLISLVLKSKLDCIDAQISKSGDHDQWTVSVLSAAKRMLLFQYFCVEEMWHRYIELEVIQNQNILKEQIRAGATTSTA